MRKIDIWKDTASALSTDGRKNDVLWPDSLGDGPGLCGTHGEKYCLQKEKDPGTGAEDQGDESRIREDGGWSREVQEAGNLRESTQRV